ncbi:MAG: caspase family protein, partial [Candidatus Thorarchaeota archaeon]
MGGRRFVGWMLFSLVMVFTSVASFATTYGIVIGVATYADPRIEDLTYAATDAISFAQSLQEQSDVSPSRITLLTNDEAARVAIEQAFTDIAAITSPEDKVIIYFSGHGASVPDLNGDEADGDGNDEAFLPYDAARGDPSSYVIDDDLGEWVARIPAN